MTEVYIYLVVFISLLLIAIWGVNKENWVGAIAYILGSLFFLYLGLIFLFARLFEGNGFIATLVLGGLVILFIVVAYGGFLNAYVRFGGNLIIIDSKI